jgi:hypothetical protein
MPKFVKDAPEVLEAVKTFEEKVYAPQFELLMRGYYYEKDTCFHMLDFFVRCDDERAVDVLAIINRFYDISDLVVKEFNDYVESEKYEYCELYKKYKLI